MSKKKLRIISSLILAVVFLGFQLYNQYLPSKNVLSVREKNPKSSIQNQSIVVKVIDGDTLEILQNGKKEKVRVLGINTPETVDPRRPVQCFGKEASDHAKNLLLNKSVRLEADTTQADRDKYGRLLRYVFFSDGTDFDLRMIKEGYAYEYTYEIPYALQKNYRAAQKEAENSNVGLWSDNACRGKM